MPFAAIVPAIGTFETVAYAPATLRQITRTLTHATPKQRTGHEPVQQVSAQADWDAILALVGMLFALSVLFQQSTRTVATSGPLNRAPPGTFAENLALSTAAFEQRRTLPSGVR